MGCCAKDNDDDDGRRINNRGKCNYSKKNLTLCHFVHQKTHMEYPGNEAGYLGREAGDQLPGLRHGPHVFLTSFVPINEQRPVVL